MVKLDCSSTQDFADGSILSTNESIFRDMVKLDCSSTQDFADGSILSTNESIIIESDSDDDDDDTLAGKIIFIHPQSRTSRGGGVKG